MTPQRWPTAPPDVRRQIHDLRRALQGLLGEDLLALYLHGSLALGCFNPRRSDVDLLALCRQPLAPGDRARIAAAVLQASRRPAPVEISILAREDLNPWTHPCPFQFHYSEDFREIFTERLRAGGEAAWDEGTPLDEDLSAHCTVARARGVALLGPPPRDALPAPPPEDYSQSLVEDWRWARSGGTDDATYFILNACRVRAWFAHGHILSKSEGGRWALTRLPAHARRLVLDALNRYESPTAPQAPSPAAKEVDAFAQLMEHALEPLAPRFFTSTDSNA